MAALPITVDDQSGLSVGEIGTRARRLQDSLDADGRKLDTIWVDHLGFIKMGKSYKGQRHLEIGEATKGLKKLAKEFDVAVIALCQLSRGIEGREDKSPQLSDLRDSGQIEEDTDTAIFVYRMAYYLAMQKYQDNEKEQKRIDLLANMANIIDIRGLKTRNGSTFVRKFFADMGSNCIRDLR